MTHRHANLNQQVADRRNFSVAFDGYSKGKHHRDKVSRFEAHLDDNLNQLLSDYVDGSWQVSDYEERIINDRKRRRVAILPPIFFACSKLLSMTPKARGIMRNSTR